jgi:hypothetical protein
MQLWGGFHDSKMGRVNGEYCFKMKLIKRKIIP